MSQKVLYIQYISVTIPYICTEAVSNGNKTNITHIYLPCWLFLNQISIGGQQDTIIIFICPSQDIKIMHVQQADCNTP